MSGSIHYHYTTQNTVCPACEMNNSELERLRESHQWQPIETAPKDGRLLLIATSAAWSLAYNNGLKWWLMDNREEKMEPTHWMPLPPLPEAEHDH